MEYTDAIIGKRAMYSYPSDKGVECGICPHNCNLSEGQRGLCRSRVNHGGVLYSDAYGRLCALHIDPIEKKPLLHFHPASRCLSIASTGCNFACLNCQNWEISQIGPSETENIELSPEELVATCLKTNCISIAYTYTEPITFYEYTYDSALLAHQKGIYNILVSTGYINEKPLKQLCRVIDAANIDLKSFSEELYKKLNHGSLQPVLNTLKTLKSERVWLEITNLLIPTWNDDPNMIHRMCRWLIENGFEDTPLHFSRFFPAYKMNDLPPTPLDTLINAREIARQEGLKYVYIGNVGEFQGENTICPSCGRIIVRRNGFEVLEKHIGKDKCAYCDTPIAGEW